MPSQTPRSFATRRTALALALLALAACSPDSPVSPVRTRPDGAPLASKQTTTASMILLGGTGPDGTTGIFSLDDDGTNLRKLATAPVFEPVSWAPDGKSVLFERAGAIAVMNADGTGITLLTSPPSGCDDLFPETLGKQLVFERECEESDTELYLMNSDGTGLTLLARPVIGSPAPSPKAKQVAFVTLGDIWLLDLDTGGRTNLTKTGTLGGIADPAFSPSGKQIAFANGTGIAIMNADGTSVTQLTSGGELIPRWSPDGKRILLNTGTDASIVNADGTGVTNLTQSLGGTHALVGWAWARY
jgi:Tol biopolymer transport system component